MEMYLEIIIKMFFIHIRKFEDIKIAMKIAMKN